MSAPVDRLRRAISDPARKRVTVRAADLRMLLFAAGFSDEDPDAAARSGKPINALVAAATKERKDFRP